MKESEIIRTIKDYYNLDWGECRSVLYSNPDFFIVYKLVFGLREKLIKHLNDFFYERIYGERDNNDV